MSVCRGRLRGVKTLRTRTGCTLNILVTQHVEKQTADDQKQGDEHFVVVLGEGGCQHVFYLRTWVIQVYVAGIHILCHDDEGQEVRGVERARIAARMGVREGEKSSTNSNKASLTWKF